jgi:hypothetical protein
MNRRITSFRKRYSQRGLGTVEGFLLVIGLCVAYHYAANWIADWRGAEWTESRLQALAEQTVLTAKMAQRAGVDVVKTHDMETALQRLGSGETATEGRFAQQTFAVKDLADAKAREKLQHYLKIEKGHLALMTDSDRRVRGLD